MKKFFSLTILLLILFACSDSTKTICNASADAVYDWCKAKGLTDFACGMERQDQYDRCMYERGCNPFID